MIYYSPLRYPGGKGKIACYFEQIFHLNSLVDGVYVEPYAGGAAIALFLLFNNFVSKVVLNDIDLSIYALWYSVLNRTEELCRLIRDTTVDVKTWEHQRVIQRNKGDYDLLELGFSTFFLNRSNRSGILNAGLVGGLAQSGKWKMDARFNKSKLINRIQQIGLHRDRIELHNLDAILLVRMLRNKLPEKTLFYLDPPYYSKGRKLYLNYYRESDHVAVANEIGKIVSQKWVVTYDSVPFIEQLYTNHRQSTYTLNYTACKLHKGNELMIFSDNLIVPALDTKN